MRVHPATVVLVVVLLGAAGSVGWMAYQQGRAASQERAQGGPTPVAVETAVVQSGLIRDVRELSGTLEASARFVVAAKTGGLLIELEVDLSDEIERGRVIGRIDDQQFVQAVAQAEAELAVRRAELTRAQARLGRAATEYEREKTLRDQGVSSEAQHDEALAAFEGAEAERAVAVARVEQAEAALRVAKIRLDETRIRADWSGGPDVAVVGERHQDAGNTLSVGDPVVTAVTLDPLRAVVFVTERDYGRLRVGQAVSLRTDAVPGRVFDGSIARISPVFREASRQARVEIRVENPELVLRPGMFVRARIVLRSEEAGAKVPLEAIARRGDRRVLFVVDDAGEAVREVEVGTGIVEDGWAQVIEPSGVVAGGRVVTLGQQLLDDGSPVHVADENVADGAAAGEGPGVDAAPAAPEGSGA